MNNEYISDDTPNPPQSPTTIKDRSSKSGKLAEIPSSPQSKQISTPAKISPEPTHSKPRPRKHNASYPRNTSRRILGDSSPPPQNSGYIAMSETLPDGNIKERLHGPFEGFGGTMENCASLHLNRHTMEEGNVGRKGNCKKVERVTPRIALDDPLQAVDPRVPRLGQRGWFDLAGAQREVDGEVRRLNGIADMRRRGREMERLEAQNGGKAGRDGSGL